MVTTSASRLGRRLPEMLTSLVGREREVAEAAGLLRREDTPEKLRGW